MSSATNEVFYESDGVIVSAQSVIIEGSLIPVKSIKKVQILFPPKEMFNLHTLLGNCVLKINYGVLRSATIIRPYAPNIDHAFYYGSWKRWKKIFFKWKDGKNLSDKQWKLLDELGYNKKTCDWLMSEFENDRIPIPRLILKTLKSIKIY